MVLSLWSLEPKFVSELLILAHIAIIIAVIFIAYMMHHKKMLDSVRILTKNHHLLTILKMSPAEVVQYISLIVATILIPFLFIKQLDAEQKLIQGFADPNLSFCGKQIIIVLIFQLIHESAWRLRDIIKIHFSARIKNNIFNYFLSTMIDKEYSFFRTHPASTVPFIAKQTSSACEKIANISTKLIIHISYICVALWKMYSISTLCGIAMLILAIGWAVGSICLWSALSAQSTEYSHINNNLIEGCDDSASNIDIIKSLYTENIEKQKISQLLHLRLSKEIYINTVMWRVWVIQGTIFITLFATIMYHLSNTYSKLEMVGLCSVCMRLLTRFCEIIWHSSEDLEEYVKESGRLKYGLNIINSFTAENKQSLIEYKLPEDIAISCKNIIFQYNQDQQVFNFNVNFERNKITAIIGPSGSGKSTLAKIISDVIQPLSGHAQKYSNAIAYMQQSPIIFRNSLKYNIAYGSNTNAIDLGKMSEILSQVNFIIPQNITYDTKLNSGTMSGGQLQKIMMARALYNDADILILDEPTSALDNQSMEDTLLIIQSLKNRTRIMISHSKRTMKIADNIVIIEDGSVAYTGTLEDVKNHETYHKYLD